MLRPALFFGLLVVLNGATPVQSISDPSGGGLRGLVAPGFGGLGGGGGGGGGGGRRPTIFDGGLGGLTTLWSCDENTGFKSRIVKTTVKGVVTSTTETAPCDPVPCTVYPVTLDPGKWGSCVQEDDGWYKYKTLAIQVPAKFGGFCPPEADRQAKMPCPPVACVINSVAEDTGTYAACQQKGDNWYKHRVLGIKTQALYGGTCPDPSDPVRDDKQLCAPVNCVVNTPAEDTGAFGACQDDGIGWYQHRVLGIKTQAQYGGTCPPTTDPSRDDTKYCSPVNCVINTAAEDTGAFGACQDDGNGWYQHRVLGIKTQAQYGGTCPLTTDPSRDDTQYCTPVPCVINKPSEDTGAFGACRDDGNGWYQHRVLGIKTQAQYGGTCPPTTDPSRDDTQYCTPVPCVINKPSEDTGAFGACQDDGNGWYQHRVLGIKTQSQYGGTCPPTTDPSRDDTQYCTPVPCVINKPSEDTGAFGGCQDDGSGWYQHRALGIKTQAQYGGTCPLTTDPSRDNTQYCTPVNCVINSAAEDTGAFGVCQNDGDTWNQHRVLGIKTQAQYGGTCPPTTDPSRDDTKLCPPVSCVINTPAEDTGTFGACQLENGVWYKHKVLGIKTQAQYGGTCPSPTDTLRDYKEVCPPVACVVKSVAEDTGAYGACQMTSTGWFKTKVLAIKTPALYGGSCPSETDRTVRTQCTRSCNYLAPGRGIGSASYYETIKSVVSKEACCELCKSKTKCEAFVFYKANPLTSQPSQCWIQSAQRTLFSSPTAFAGTVTSA